VRAFDYVVDVRAAEGERNVLTLELGDGGLIVTERGAPLVVKRGCTDLGGGRARCEGNVYTDARVELGDEADIARVGFRGADTGGGPGDDRLAGVGYLRGGEGADTIALRVSGTLPSGVVLGAAANGEAGDDAITGSDGADLLVGGAGRDIVRGGDGDDDVRESDASGGEAVADVLDGGPGFDVINVLDDRDVVADLAAAGRQLAGPPDDVVGFEAIGTTGGDDVVRGTDRRNRISTGAGRDTIHAGGGSDLVFSGPDADIVDAGGDFLTDKVACGGGEDLLLRAETIDAFRACDVILLTIADRPVTTLERRGNRVRAVLRCERVTLDCRGDVELRRRGASVGRAAFACPTDPCASGWMRLPRSPRRARLTAITTFADGRGEAVQNLTLPR
jgi:Ca2+-binding RTX toxin-like protein